MRTVIGWIETILGVVLIITPIIAMFYIVQFSGFLDIETTILPTELSGPVDSAVLFAKLLIQVLGAAYLLVVFLIGLLMLLEGLAKIKN